MPGLSSVQGKGQLKALSKALVHAGGYCNCGSRDISPFLLDGFGQAAARTSEGWTSRTAGHAEVIAGRGGRWVERKTRMFNFLRSNFFILLIAIGIRVHHETIVCLKNKIGR
jgi:hypothetical protein